MTATRNALCRVGNCMARTLPLKGRFAEIKAITINNHSEKRSSAPLFETKQQYAALRGLWRLLLRRRGIRRDLPAGGHGIHINHERTTQMSIVGSRER